MIRLQVYDPGHGGRANRVAMTRWALFNPAAVVAAWEADRNVYQGEEARCIVHTVDGKALTVPYTLDQLANRLGVSE